MFAAVFEFKCLVTRLALDLDRIQHVVQESCLVTRDVVLFAHRAFVCLAVLDADFAEDILALLAHCNVLDQAET